MERGVSHRSFLSVESRYLAFCSTVRFRHSRLKSTNRLKSIDFLRVVVERRMDRHPSRKRAILIRTNCSFLEDRVRSTNREITFEFESIPLIDRTSSVVYVDRDSIANCRCLTLGSRETASSAGKHRNRLPA